MRIGRSYENQSNLDVLTKNVEVKFKGQNLDERQERQDASGKIHWVKGSEKRMTIMCLWNIEVFGGQVDF